MQINIIFQKFMMSYLDYIETHTYKKPDISEGNFPLLIFSHGLYSEANGYYALIEEIVSHGFVVLNIKLYLSKAAEHYFQLKKTFYFTRKEFDQKNNNSDMAEMAWERQCRTIAMLRSEREKLKATEYLIRNYVGAEITNRWSQDITILLSRVSSCGNQSHVSL
ncbi:MAG: hypothetical protein U5L09_13800 [Bacteroidales bacterium]|nr:hypothetical protein [Bacteroidales bacterium]